MAVYAIVLSAYSIGYTSTHSLDVSSLIHADGRLCVGCGGIYLYPGDGGYDGTFFYLMAKNPFSLSQLRDSASEREQAYRYQRILYPLLAYAASLGRVALIPWALLAINIMALVVAWRIFEIMLMESGRPVRFSLYIPLIVGVFAGVLLDLVEPLWLALTLAAFYWLRKGGLVRSSIAFAFAMFAKETTLFLLLPVVAYYAYERRYGSAVLFSAPLLPFILWESYLYAVFHAVGMLRLDPPCVCNLVVFVLSAVFSPDVYMFPVYLLMLTAVPILWMSAEAFRRKITPVTASLLANSVWIFALMLYRTPWAEIFSASRSFLPLTVALLLYFVESGDRRVHYVVALQVLITLAMFVLYLVKAAQVLF